MSDRLAKGDPGVEDGAVDPQFCGMSNKAVGIGLLAGNLGQSIKAAAHGVIGLSDGEGSREGGSAGETRNIKLHNIGVSCEIATGITNIAGTGSDCHGCKHSYECNDNE